MQINKHIDLSSYEKDSNFYTADALDQYKSRILDYVRKQQNGISLQTIYRQLELEDLGMYVAVHELITDGLLDGVSPYEVDDIFGQGCSHNMLFYYPVNKEEN